MMMPNDLIEKIISGLSNGDVLNTEKSLALYASAFELTIYLNADGTVADDETGICIRVVLQGRK